MDTSFKNWSREQETKLRGVYLTFSADTEWVLAMIITKIFFQRQDEFVIQLKKIGVKKKLLSRLTLEEKTKLAIVSLHSFHANFYAKHKTDFEHIDRLRDLRNKFAHGRITWDDDKEDKTSLQISMIRDNHIETVPYDRINLWKELMDYSHTMERLLQLVNAFLSEEIAQ